MHGRRVATGVALLISVGSLTPLPAAHAATGATLYVNNTILTCSDTTMDSSVTPYCTIPAAMNAVTPGETISLGGIYPPFSVTKSGTPSQPITITGGTSAVHGSAAAIQVTSGSANLITVTNASYVNLIGLRVNAYLGSPVVISGSDHISLDGLRTGQASAAVVPQVQAVSSSQLTISRSQLRGGMTTPMISITGGTGDTITTNAVENLGNLHRPGIALDGVTSSAITSNSVSPWCGYGISVSNGSTSTTIENNVVAQLAGPTAVACPAATASSPNLPLAVDSSSTPGSKADYNDVNAASDTNIAYSWGGSTYADAGSLTAATSQGAHDSNSVSSVSIFGQSSPVAVDSADASAPGELNTDILGNPRVDDPLVADSGTGTLTYYDRGTVEYVDPISATFSSSVPRALTGVPVTVSAAVTDPWSVTDFCAIDYGDGTVTDQVPVTNGTCSASHPYSTAGTYFPTVTATNSYGGRTTVNGGPLQIAVPAPFLPKLVVSPIGGLSVEADATGSTDEWPISDYKFDFGDGTIVEGTSALDTDHPYAKAGTYTVTVTETDLDGQTASTSARFTTAASYYTPVSPVRILDTRKGIGVPTVAKVPANGTLSLKIAGVAGVPQTGLRAVALNVTVVNPTQTGYITAYPADATPPTTSNLDFTPGRTFANSVIVKVGANGSVSFKNGSGGTVDLVADLAGYYSDDSTYGYTSVSPIRLLDTRKSASTIAANGVHKLYVGNYTGAAAVALNVTVTNPKQGGYLTAYPDGENRPVVSNLDFMAGQTIANQVIVKVGADGYVDFANTSAGSTDLIVDIDGYFRSGSGSFFTPITPTRAWDVETVGIGTTDVPIGYDAGSSDLWGLRGGSIAANLTVADPSDGGYLSAYPDDATTTPTISALDFPANQTVTNAATVTLGSQNYGIDLHLAESGVARLIVDVFGYYSTT